MDRIKGLLNKDISSWIKKYKIGIASVLVLVLLGIVGMFVTYAYYQVNDTTKVINAGVTEIPDLEIRVYAQIRDSNGNGLNGYGEYPYIPQAGYQYNSASSYCVNGGIINYSSTNHNVDITSDGVDLCYLYFDSIAQLDITINVMAENVDNDGVGVGTYTKLETAALPSVGYTLSSYTCTNGSTISYSEADNLYTVNSSGKDECTIYMDAVNPDISLKMFVQASENSSEYTEVSKLKGCYTMRKNETDHNSSCTGTSEIDYINGKVVISATSKTDCIAYLDISNECSGLELARSIYKGQGVDGLYYHNDKLTNGAGDYSYRYAGANPNNYICFGSDASTCPDANLYRIIGVIPVDVVVDATDPNNIVTEKQSLIKIIKNDYETESSIGMTRNGNPNTVDVFQGPEGNHPTGTVDGFYWNNTSPYYNTWSISTLNTNGLNTTAYNSFNSSWQNLIANVMWIVGGRDDPDIRVVSPINVVYSNEINHSGENNTYVSNDGKIEIPNKIGLMYVHEYGFAAPQTAWSSDFSNYNLQSIRSNNWLYKGLYEWTITRNSRFNNYSFYIGSYGTVSYHLTNYPNALRRVFYLNQSVTFDKTAHTGSKSDPYRVNSNS